MSIGKRLLEVRKSTGLSQAEFGKLFELSDRAYKNYELEIRDLPIRKASAIAKRYSINLNWLINGEGARNSAKHVEKMEKSLLNVERFLEAENLVTDVKGKARLLAIAYEHFSDEFNTSQEIIDLSFKGIIYGAD